MKSFGGFHVWVCGPVVWGVVVWGVVVGVVVLCDGGARAGASDGGRTPGPFEDVLFWNRFRTGFFGES
jgi:hypothetical protein